jgi:hypothetical protein
MSTSVKCTFSVHSDYIFLSANDTNLLQARVHCWKLNYISGIALNMVRNIFPYISLNIYHTKLEPFRPEIHVNNISTLISYLRDIYIYIYTQRIPAVKVTTSRFNARADSESKLSYTHGSNSQRFRSYEVLSTVNKLEKKEEHCAFIEMCC